MVNTLAYYGTKLVMTVESFRVQQPGDNVTKLYYSSLTLWESLFIQFLYLQVAPFSASVDSVLANIGQG